MSPDEPSRGSGPGRGSAEPDLRAVLDGLLGLAVVALDPAGLVTEWSAGAERILGWPAAEMRGASIARIFTPEDRAAGASEAELRRALAEGRSPDERQHLRRDGSRFWASGEVRPLFDAAGTHRGFVKHLRERDAERDAESRIRSAADARLRESEDRLVRAQEAGGVGLFSIDVAEDVMQVTPEFCRLYGLPPRPSLAPAEIERLVLAEDGTKHSHRDSRRRGDAPREAEYRFRRADTGEIRWIARRAEFERDAAGRVVRMFGAVRDITDTVAARRALAAERDRLAQMFEQAPTFMALLRGPEHRFERVNPGYVRLVGGRDVVGRTVAEALPDAVAQGFLALLDRVQRTAEPFEATGHRYAVQAVPGGPVEERFVDFVFQPIRDADGAVTGIFVEGADVTERARAGERLALAVEATGIGIFDFDPVAGRLGWDARLRALFGAPAEGAVGYEETFLAGLHPDDRPRADAAVRAALDPAGPGAFDVEYRVRALDTGEERWIAARGQAIFAGGRAVRFVGTVRDVSAGRRAEAALRATEERYRLASRATNDAVWDWDLVADRVLWNEALTAAHGHALDAVAPTGAWWLAHIHPDDRERVSRSIHAVIDGAEGSWTGRYRFLRADGSHAEIVDRGHVIRDGAGRAVRMIGAMLDVTESRAAARRQAALLELSDRLRDLADPEAIAHAASEVLGRTLGVSRVGYGLVDRGAETITIARDWNAPGIATLAGVLHFRDYGSYIDDLKRGDTAVVADARTDPRTAANAGALEAISARAFVNMPLVERGHSVALLYANHAEARAWPDEDLGLMREVAERVRAATERARSEEALRESEERFRGITNSVDQMIWSTQADGFHDYYNDRWYAYTGMAPGSTDGEAWNGMFHPDDQDRAWATWRRSLETGEPYRIEYRLRHRSGTYRWVLGRAQAVHDASGRITRWFGTCTDIQEIIDAREVLARSREELEAEVTARTQERDRLWRLSRDPFLVADADGRWLSVSPAWTEILGWREAELLGRTSEWMEHPDDREKTRAEVGAIAGGASTIRFENRFRAKDGTYRWFSWTAVSADGLMFCNARDVTAEKEQAEALARTEAALRQAQKMEAVGQLTGGIAHDFNNLLTGITGSLELLGNRIAQGRIKDVERYVTAAQGAAKRAAALTHRLLAFSRRQTLDPKPTDVNRLVAGMEELIRRTVGPAIAVEVVAAGGLWPTLVDPPQLENALLNLCINARDAMPEGGRLTIETGNRWLDHRMARERGLQPGQYISLCVSDTGTGMTPDVIAKAFDPFFTTKPLGQGTGLGLSMIYGFAQQSGGQARIYSEPGEGAMVCLYLPRHLGAAEEGEAPPDLADAPRAGAGETVLIVDDEPTVRMLVTEVLEELGYAAIEAGDGASGLKVLQSDVRIDLLVTDVGLPGGMNGRQMADAARSTRPGLKVLFITGYAENAVVGNGHLEAGMHVMTKPFAMEALASRIKELIAG